MSVSNRISGRDRRTLIVGAVVIVPALVVGRGLPALTRWQAAQIQQASVVAEDASRVRAAMRSLPRLRDSLTERRKRLALLDSTLLAAGSASAAAVQLASVLRAIADSSGVRVGSMQLQLDTASKNALVIVGVRVSGTTDATGLASFLRSVEGGAALMVVRELAVTQPDPAAPDGKAEALRIEAVVEAIARLTSENKT